RLTSAFVPAVGIRRPDGTPMCSAREFAAKFVQLECTLDQAGSYAVSVADRNFNQTGDYTFSLNRLNSPPGGTPVAYGQVVTGTHSPSAEVDFYTFTGAIAERVLVRLTSAFVPAVGIRRPDGTPLCSGHGCASNFVQLERALDQAGTYAVSVTDRNFTQVRRCTFFWNRSN